MSDLVFVRCETCDWSVSARDFPWVKRAGEVHVDTLKKGHVLENKDPQKVEK